jgi:hypothetical protein
MFRRFDNLYPYSIVTDNYTIHEIVRYDPGVEVVTHNGFIKPITEVDTGEIETRSKSNFLRRWTRYNKKISDYWPLQISSFGKVDTAQFPLTFVGSPILERG